ATVNNPPPPPNSLPFFAPPMKADPDRLFIRRERTARYIPRFQCDVRRETMTSGRVGSPACISEHADQFDFYSLLSLHQTHRNVHSFAATSWTTSSGRVTSLKTAVMSSPEILAKSFSNGATKIPQR